jgi:hypothetical protein
MMEQPVDWEAWKIKNRALQASLRIAMNTAASQVLVSQSRFEPAANADEALADPEPSTP